MDTIQPLLVKRIEVGDDAFKVVSGGRLGQSRFMLGHFLFVIDGNVVKVVLAKVMNQISIRPGPQHRVAMVFGKASGQVYESVIRN